MNRTLFSGLIILTLIAVVVAFSLSREAAGPGDSPAGLLMPQLPAQVNEIDWIRVSTAGETVATALRDDGAWVIEEAGGYRADWPVVQALLSGLSSAEIVEPKTANPDYYERLGVQDPSLPDAPGVLVEFRPATGLPGVIIGNEPQGRGGQYLRLADSAQTVLIDRELDAPKTTDGWVDSEIIDISDDEVVEVAITHPDEDDIVARKVSADDENFILQNIPEGMNVRSAWSVNALAGGFSGLEADEVRPADEIDWSGAVRYRVVTVDGLLAEARAVAVSSEDEEDESFWILLEAGTYTTALDGATEQGGEVEAAGRAGEINERTRGWAYRIPGSRHDTMTKTMDELLESAVSDE